MSGIGVQNTPQENFRLGEIRAQNVQAAAVQGFGPWSDVNHVNGMDLQSDQAYEARRLQESIAQSDAIQGRRLYEQSLDVAQERLRSTERDYRQATDTGAVIRPGDTLERVTSGNKELMGRYARGMGLADLNQLQVGQSMRADWDMSARDALGVANTFYAADGQRKLAAAAQATTTANRVGMSYETDVVASTAVAVNRSAVDMIPTGGYLSVQPLRAEPTGVFSTAADWLDKFQTTEVGKLLQGLPPEGFIVGGLKTGLNALGKAERVLSSTSEAKLGLQTLDPTTVSFTQSSVSFAKAGANYSLDSLVTSMSKEGWVGKPIDIVAMPDGTLAAIDNTRVLAARRAGIEVQANVRSFDEAITDPVRQLTLTERGNVPATWGEAALLRINKPVQNATYPGMNPSWSVRFPYGSLYDPAVK